MIRGKITEVVLMPRMPAYLKKEWALFLNERGRKAYNGLCRRCAGDCKQSFRADIVRCPYYRAKRKPLKSRKTENSSSDFVFLSDEVSAETEYHCRRNADDYCQTAVGDDRTGG